MRHAETILNLFRFTLALIVGATVCAMNITIALGAFLLYWGVL